MTQENLLARRLKHRNIVAAMEMPDGESLRKVLDAGPLPIARAIRIAHDIASGLAYAHLEGVVHGSLTLSNIIVTRSGVAKITDFGIGQAALQLRGDPIDHRGDVFSLGALFYEMLTQRPPVEGSPPPPSELNPHVPRALDAIVLSMLAAQPADRMAGVPILLRELQRLEEGLGLGSGANAAADEPTASVPPAGPEPAEAFQHRNPDPASDRDELNYRRARMEREREAERNRRFASRIETLASVGVVLAVLGIGFGGFMYYSSGPSARVIAASRMQEAPPASRPTAPAPVAEAPKEPVAASGAWQKSPPRAVDERQAEQKSSGVGTPRPIAPPPVAEAIKEPAATPVAPQASGTLFGLKVPSKPAAAEPAPLPQAESLVARASEQPASARAAPEKELPRIKQPAAKVAAQQPRGTAQLILAVSPGGEIYIDGEHHGTTPPVTTFDLEPGMHHIEVRSGSRKPFVTYMTVEPGDVRRIRHDFDAKPSGPPG